MRTITVVEASVDGVVNSTAFICNVTYHNHLTPCRILIEHEEGVPVPTNFQVLRRMIETSSGNLSEITIDGCSMYMTDTDHYDTNEEEL